MIEIKEKSRCSGCHSCFNACPVNAIEMIEDEKGFKYPKVNSDKCINCNLCEKVCPILNKKEFKNEPKAYACYFKNEEVRKESSSGGLFTVIAEYILDNNGVIYGASFNDEFLVDHIRIDKKEDLYKLRTSKYMQSNINNCFNEAKKDLDENRLVYFTGTPCEVNGFLFFLNGKKYSNLYTQDIVCHGVPSPKVWKKYLEYRKNLDKNNLNKVNSENEDILNPVKVNFRQKDTGWTNYEMFIKYDDNSNEYKIDHNQDLYMNAFLRNASLRESCFDCSFKDKNRKTDITLADFWGVENVLPEFNDNKGTSLVIINSEKGKQLFDNIQNKIVCKETDFEESIKYNPSMYVSSSKPEKYDDFFQNLDILNFNELVEKYTIKPKKQNLIVRILRKIKSIFVK